MAPALGWPVVYPAGIGGGGHPRREIDRCPEDPNKTEPGICGCGVAESDCADLCPDDPNKTNPGVCGCGIPDLDTDLDGTFDCNDLCPLDPNKIAPGICGCGGLDIDSDADGTFDCNDLCPADPNKIAPGACGCGVADTDTDLDETLDCNEICDNDPLKTSPGICGCGVADSGADVDIDNDLVPACLDCNDRNSTLGPVQGTARYVDPAGSDTANTCTVLATPCQTIAHAINVSNAGDTILLTTATYNERNLLIQKNLFIFGRGPLTSIIDGTSVLTPDRVFTVENPLGQDPKVSATFCGVTITGGLEDDSVGGAGIANLGSRVAINNSVITENSVISNDLAFGGGISATSGSDTFISDSTISNNTAQSTGLLSCLAQGGGMANGIDSNFDISSCVVSGNTVSVASSLSTCSAQGGGVYNANLSGGYGFINNSSISDNTANAPNSFGAGLYVANTSSGSINNTTINGNYATGSVGSISCQGGGVYLVGGGAGPFNVLNSTISGNEASCLGLKSGGGFYIDALGQTVTIASTTIANNTATFGGGIYAFIPLLSTISIGHTILSNNDNSNCNVVGGVLNSTGYNLDSDGTCSLSANGDAIAAALLGPLQNNGGPTQTHELLSGSPAIDTGNTTCGVGIDQRNFTRPIGSACDKGAFEVQLP